MRFTRSACCARTASGNESADQPTTVMNSRRLTQALIHNDRTRLSDDLAHGLYTCCTAIANAANVVQGLPLRLEITRNPGPTVRADLARSNRACDLRG